MKRPSPSPSPSRESDDEQSDGSHGTSVAGMVWVITFLKIVTCKLCGCGCNEPSPLNSAKPQDRWGGYRPWLKYRKSVDAKVLKYEKAPRAQFCLLCYNVYKALSSWLSRQLAFRYLRIGLVHMR